MGNRRSKKQKHLARKREYNGTKLITTWKELAECENDSETHIMKIDIAGGNGNIKPRSGLKDIYDYAYLSTHTFYGHQYKESTKTLQQRGFNVIIANWDELGY